MSKPNYVLGVDLDNVTAKYTQGLRNYLVSQGHDVADLPEPIDYCFVKSGWPFESTEDFLRVHGEFVKSGGFLRLEAMEDASESLYELIDNGVHIRVITHRIFGKGMHGQSISDTVRWLDAHRIPYNDFCVVSDKSAIGANLLIDDAPSNINAVRDNGGDVVVFDQLYNRDLADPRVRNWKEVVPFVLQHKRDSGL